MSDSLSCGRRLRIMNLIDALPDRQLLANAEKDVSRECLAAVVDTSLSGIRVARELNWIAQMRGYLGMVASDN